MAILEVKNVKKSFGSLNVINGIDLKVERGEVIAIVGPSGGGKSTFIRCLNRLEHITSGEILIDGEALVLTRDGKTVYVSEKEARRICGKTGMVFQSFNLFPHMSVLENIIAAPVNVKKVPRDKAIKAARELLLAVGLSDKENSYPSEISGGQQQRVAIARALCMNPEILFFDEPTSALDPELTVEVLRVIKNLAKKHMTMLIVTHEMDFAKDVADRIVFMDGGKIVADLPPQEFFESDNERVVSFIQRYDE